MTHDLIYFDNPEIDEWTVHGFIGGAQVGSISFTGEYYLGHLGNRLFRSRELSEIQSNMLSRAKGLVLT